MTMDAEGAIAEAIAICGDRIACVGRNEEVEAMIQEDTEVIRLDGRCVIPGFIDAHAHIELAALARHVWLDVRDLAPGEAISRMVEYAATVPSEDWVLAQGTFGQGLVTREELDRALPNHPAAMRVSMHLLVANSKALEQSGIRRDSSSPVGTKLMRNEEGDLSGVIQDGWDMLGIAPLKRDTLLGYLRETMQAMFQRHGVTSVYDLPASQEAIHCYQNLSMSRELPVRLRMQITIPPGHQPIVPLSYLIALGLQSGFGNEWLSLGGIKIFADGWGLSAYTTTSTASRAEDWGLAQRTYQALASEVTEAMKSGLQVWIHAGGDLALEMALSAIEEATRKLRKTDHRARIEHIGNDGCSDADIYRMQEAGIIPVPNPTFIYASSPDGDGPAAENHGRFCLRTLKEAGFPTPGNSDHAGTQPFATNPWFGIQRMVLRQNRDGDSISPAEAISVEDALRAYTVDAAYAGCEEHEKGTLQAGKLADLVILSDDPLSIEVDRLETITADATILGGRVVYERGHESSAAAATASSALRA